MNSLKGVYASLVAQEKLAAEKAADSTAGMDDQTKLAMQQALDYDLVGRRLAHQVFDDLMKEATAEMPVGHGPGHRHEDGRPCAPHCEHHGKAREHAEKRASLEHDILARMAQDPAYVSELIARHAGK